MASVLVLAEIAISIGALVAIVVLLVKRRFDWALGLFLGWLVGPVGATVLALAQTDSVN